jgi:hypothetical protein
VHESGSFDRGSTGVQDEADVAEVTDLTRLDDDTIVVDRADDAIPGLPETGGTPGAAGYNPARAAGPARCGRRRGRAQ